MSTLRPSQNLKSNTKHPFFKGFFVAAVVSLVALSAAPASFAITQRIAPYTCPDITRDGNVDMSDLSALAAALEPATYDPNADLNTDGHVTRPDAAVLAGFFGQTGLDCSSDAVWIIQAACPDITRDGNVDASDISALAAAMPPAAYDANADLNGDGTISQQDTSVLEGYLGRTGFICNDASNEPTLPVTSEIVPPPSSIRLGPACPDITRDGNVDASDLSALASALPPAAYNWAADLNGDGLISQQDAQVWDGYRGQTGMICDGNLNRPVWNGPCPDLTGDGYADASDVSALAAALEPAKYSAMADLNGDGIVNNQDSAVLGGYLGQSGLTCNRPHVPVAQVSTDIVEVTLPPTPVETIQPQPTVPLTAPIEPAQTQPTPVSSPAAMPTVVPVVPTITGTTPTRHITQSQNPAQTFTARATPKKTSLLKKMAMKLRKVSKNSLKLKLVVRNPIRTPRLR